MLYISESCHAWVILHSAFAAGASTTAPAWWVMSHKCHKLILLHIYKSCHTWVMSHIWMSHVTHMNEFHTASAAGTSTHSSLPYKSCHMHVTHDSCHISTSVCHSWVMWHTVFAAGASTQFSIPDESCHVNITNESYYTSMSLVIHEPCFTLHLPRGPPHKAHRLISHVTSLSRMIHVTHLWVLSYMSHVTHCFCRGGLLAQLTA